MRVKNTFFLMLIMLAIVLLLSGCGGSAQTNDAKNSGETKSQEPIKVGVVQPLSGPVANSGQDVLWGAELAVKVINEQGGINGRQLKLVVLDSKNDPAEAVNAANKLINNDNVKVILGFWGSSPTLAALPIIEKAGIPLVVETASAPKITQQGYKFVFRIAATSDQEARGVEQALGSKVGVKKAAILAVNNDWGRGGAQAYTEAVKRIGGQVTTTEFIDGEATDFYPQLTEIKNSEADTIIINSDVSQIALMVKQIRELGLKQTIISAGGSNFSDALIELTGPEASEGVYSVQHSVPWVPELTPNPEMAEKFVQLWKQENKPWIGVQEGVRGFDGIFTIAEALKRIGGEEDPTKIQQALKSVDFNGIASGVKFDENGQSDTQMYLAQVVNGKTEVLK